jgi:hypothetical protein
MPALDQRYSGSVCDAIPRAKTGLLFGWVSSPDFVDERGKRIVCKFDEADIESGRELIDKWDLYGKGVHGLHSETCPSAGIRCLKGEVCGGYPELEVSFTVEKASNRVVRNMKKTEVRAVTKANGDPKLDEFDLPMFENVPVLNEHKQPVWEWQETGEVVEVFIARQLRFSRQ